MKEEIDVAIGSDEKLGAYLRRIREAHGLELNSLAESIRLNVEVLENIEQGKWDFFPIEAYLRSYIISLCEKFSLDKVIVLKKFDSEINSEYAIRQSKIGDLSEDVKPVSLQSGSSKFTIAAVVIVLVILLVVAKFLNDKDDKTKFAVEPQKDESPEFQDAEEDTLDLPNDIVSDTADSATAAPVFQPIAQAAAQVTNAEKTADAERNQIAKDTLKFECTTSLPPNDNCAIKLKGFDEKTIYFKSYITRQILHDDTAQITVTVPERTKVLINGSLVKNLARDKTLLFYKGEVVNR